MMRARSKGMCRVPSITSLGPRGTKASLEKRPVRMAAHSGMPVASSR